MVKNCKKIIFEESPKTPNFIRAGTARMCQAISHWHNTERVPLGTQPYGHAQASTEVGTSNRCSKNNKGRGKALVPRCPTRPQETITILDTCKLLSPDTRPTWACHHGVQVFRHIVWGFTPSGHWVRVWPNFLVWLGFDTFHYFMLFGVVL